MSVAIKVDSVIDSVEKIKKAGGKIKFGPFDKPIGKCAVIFDRWDNEYVILDLSKGKYTTDELGNVTGVSKNE